MIESAEREVVENARVPAPTSKRRPLVIGLGVLVLVGMVAALLWKPIQRSADDSTLVHSVQTPTEPTAENAEDSTPTANEPGREHLLGRWLLNESILRDVDIRDDGTATMQVQLDFVASLLYGSRMKLELKWELADGVLTQSIASGEPKENVAKLVKDYGDSRSYRVVRLDPESLILETMDGERTQQKWVRP